MRLKGAEKRRCCGLMAHVFGVPGFRPGQERTVAALLAGRDVLAVMPTGSGKSLCYQLPALLLPGLTLVVSPLIALMRDQVAHLTKAGVCAVALDSLQTDAEKEEAERLVRGGAAKLLFVSPERLTMPKFSALMAVRPPQMVVVDEAHCVVRWGEAFRPAYATIGEFVNGLPRRPTICAMTATADRRTRRGIVTSLGMVRPCAVRLPLWRENLHYSVVMTLRPMETVLTMAAKHGGEQGIVFCPTRWLTERTAEALNRRGIPALAYHAGMTRDARGEAQTAFMTGTCRVMAATSAFGMGIDHGGVRYVILAGMPQDLTELAQQFGRGGRDGKPADCVLLLDPAELLIWRRRLNVLARDKSVKGRIRLMKAQRGLQDVLIWALSGRCMAAALSGKRIGRMRCGWCSACIKRGTVEGRMATIPRVSHMTEDGLVGWALALMRRRIALEKRCPCRKILRQEQLNMAALRHELPEDAAAPEDLARLNAVLAHMIDVMLRRE